MPGPDVAAAAGERRKKLSCPKCRQKHAVPRGQVTELPVVFDIMGLVEQC